MSEAVAVRDPFGTATTGKLGMWLFIIMDGLSFATLLIGGAALRAKAEVWPASGAILNVPLTGFNTFLLICSSLTMVMALNAIQRDDMAGMKRFLMFTIALGVIFLGIQIWEYAHFILGSEQLAADLASIGVSGSQFIPSTSIYAAIFYGTTGFHGLHVLSGVIYITVILAGADKAGYSAQNYDRVEILGLFWHFVDLVWILVFTIIYLI